MSLHVGSISNLGAPRPFLNRCRYGIEKRQAQAIDVPCRPRGPRRLPIGAVLTKRRVRSRFVLRRTTASHVMPGAQEEARARGLLAWFEIEPRPYGFTRTGPVAVPPRHDSTVTVPGLATPLSFSSNLSFLAFIAPKPAGASAIKCYYAARGISSTAVAGTRRPANAIASGSINTDRDVGVHTKISLSVSRRVVSPACIAGVLVSRPNFNALCGRTKL